MMLLRLSWRNFVRNRSRYWILVAATATAVAALVILTGALLGVTEAVRDKASRYFGGDITVHSYADRARGSWIESPEEVESILADLPWGLETYVRRSVYYRTDATIFFAGNYISQRRLIGVEWARERDVLNGFDLVAGSVPDQGDLAGMLVSDVTAKDLQLAVGDRATLALTTRLGHRNTTQLIVRGIYSEANFFGYVTYLHRETFNVLYAHAPEEVSEIGLFLSNPSRQDRVARYLQTELSRRAYTFPVFTNREQRDRLLSRAWAGRRYAVSTLDALLAEIDELLGALALVSLAIIILFAVIVTTGVSNTYSMVVYERTTEIGTLRALGLTRTRTLWLFLWEAAIMGAVATLIGFAVGVAGLMLIRELVQLPGQGVASIFLVQGRLSWDLPFDIASLVILFGTIASVVGAFRPALSASRLRPVEAIRSE